MTPTNFQSQELFWTELKNIVFAVSEQMKENSKEMKENSKEMKENSKEMKENFKEMKENFKEMKENSKEMKENSKEIRENSKEMKEYYKQIKESLREMRENADHILKETSEQIKRTDLQIEETNRKYKELATAFTSTIGNLTEGLLDPSAVCIFQKAGFDVNRYFADMKKRDKNKKLEMQIDQFMVNGSTAIAMEIKTTCTPEKIDYFIKKMDRFKDLFPEYGDKTIYLAIAAIKYEKESDSYAHEKGLMVVRATPDNIFSLDSTEGDTLLTF